MDQDARDAAESAPPAAAGDTRGAGDFERYALIAALTLVVLCLLIWDRWHGDPSTGAAPRPDRTLRVRIGGDAAPATGAGAADEARRASNDPAKHVLPAPPPPPPPPAVRTYTVKDGDTLGAIASRELGSASRAAEIAALNGIQDAALIRKGAVLKLPPK
jgi:nucleoid-associated protein YgaU